MHLAPFLIAFQVHFSIPQGGTATALILLRWIHFLAGITWVGLLYFFVLVNAPFQQQLDGPTRAKVIPLLMPRAFWWFRWASVVTVLAGIAYWMNIVSSDAHNARSMAPSASPGTAIWSFFVIWTLAFIIFMAALMAPTESLHNGWALGMVAAILIVAGSYLYLRINDAGWESNRLLSIGVGGGIGWFMMLNVWGFIWRVQKKIIRWNAENPGVAMPADLASRSRLAALSARVNFVLTFPLLFLMGAASHYPMFGK